MENGSARSSQKCGGWRMVWAMKLLPVLFVACLGIGACSPIERDLFASGRDARVYNPQTGRYEWPEEDRPARRRKSAAVASTQRETKPEATPSGDGRVYDLEKGRYEWSDSGVPKTSPFQH